MYDRYPIPALNHYTFVFDVIFSFCIVNSIASSLTHRPLAANVTHFWRVVFEHKVPVVVMLTQLEEAGKNKCERYFPLPNRKLKFGDITVTWISAEDKPSYTKTVYQVRRIGEC